MGCFGNGGDGWGRPAFRDGGRIKIFTRSPAIDAADTPIREGFAERFFTRAAGLAYFAAGQPVAFIGATGVIIIWLVSGPLFSWSDTWQLVVNTATTIITFLMVFLIQNSQNRDAAALQAKLDEVIRVPDKARNEFIGIEHRTDTEIEAIRSALENEVANAGTGQRSFQAVERLLSRH